jgi:hypothetical protein
MVISSYSANGFMQKQLDHWMTTLYLSTNDVESGLFSTPIKTTFLFLDGSTIYLDSNNKFKQET